MWRLALAALGAVALAACHSSPAASSDQAAAPDAAPTVDGGTEGGAGAASAGGGPPNALGMPASAIAAVVNPMNLPAYEGATGTVEGTVLVRGPDAPDVPNLDVRNCPAALDTYGKLFRAGPRRADGARPLADALVVIAGYQGFYLPAKSEAVSVTIGPDCGYPKRSLALTFGQRLEVANASKVPFAPFIEGGAQLSVMIAAPLEHGQPVKVFPPRVDYYPLLDRLQPFVHGDLYVLRQPLHDVTDSQGHFRMDDVPVGRLRIAARLGALLGQAERPIDVRAGAVESVELVLTYAPADAAAPPAR